MRDPDDVGFLPVVYRAGSKGFRALTLVSMLLGMALLLAVAEVARAQPAPPPGVRISFTSDRSELTVGEVATLTIVVSHPADLAVVIPRLETEWGPFEVTAQTAVQTIDADDSTRTIARQFRLTLFAPGAFETPNLPISVRSPDGSVTQVYPDPLRLNVNSVLSGSDDQLRDIRSPADLSTPLWQQGAVLAVVALAAVVVLGGSAYYLYRRSRPRDATPNVGAETRSTWEIAVQDLDRINGLRLPESGDFKGHYTLVSGVLRAYLVATWLSNADRGDATDMSTDEIGTAIWQSSLDHGLARMAMECLQEADLVKFANHVPSTSRAYETTGLVRNLVEATRPSYRETTPVGESSRQGASP